MKNLMIKKTFTQVDFKKVTPEMVIVDSTKIINGKVSDKIAIESINDEDYLTKSVKIKVINDVFKIPYNVLESIINASLNGGFVETENKKESILTFGQPVYVKSTVSLLNLNSIEVVEKVEAVEIVKGDVEIDETLVNVIKEENIRDGYLVLTNITLPEEVFNYINKTYEVK